MNRADARRVLEAVATHDDGVPTAALARLGDRQILLLISAAVEVAADIGFPPGGDLRLIAGFARDLARGNGGADRDTAEQLLLTAVGEGDLPAEVTAEAILSTGVRVVYRIISENHLGPLDLRDYYQRVLELAEEFPGE